MVSKKHTLMGDIFMYIIFDFFHKKKRFFFSITNLLILLIFISCADEAMDEDFLILITEANQEPDCLVFSEGGDYQTSYINSTLSQPFKVVIKNKDGEILEGSEVKFKIISGANASLSNQTMESNAEGIAETTLTIGEIPGEYRVSAICGTSAATFTVNAIDPEVERQQQLKACELRIKSGDEQSAKIGTALIGPLEVIAVNALGDPLPEVTVTFTITQGEGATLDNESIITKEDGLASTRLTLGEDFGMYNVEAVCGDNKIVFSAIALDPEEVRREKLNQCILRKEGGDDQEGDVNAELVESFDLVAVNPAGEILANINVDFFLSEGDGAILSEESVTTDEEGKGSIKLTLGPNSGNYKVTAMCGFSMAEFAAMAIDPKEVLAQKLRGCKLVKVSGDGQSGIIGTTVSNEFKLQTTNLNNDPLPEADVLFEVTQGEDAELSTTQTKADEEGNVSTQLTIGDKDGIYKVTAYCGYSSQEFSTTAIDPVAVFAEKMSKCKLTKISGDEQTANISTTIPYEFKLMATDLNGVPLTGANVSFVITQGEEDSLSVTEATVDDEGHATSLLTLGPYSGIHKVSAFCGYASLEFNTTAVDPAVELAERLKKCKLTKVSGDGQSANIATTLTEEFKLLALNLNDEPLEGAHVSFAITQGDGASISVSEVNADAEGNVSTVLSLGVNAGIYKVAAYCGYSTMEFAAEAIDPNDELAEKFKGCKLTKVSGDGQSAVIGTTVSSEFKMLATDLNDDPLNGAEVTFEITQGQEANISVTLAIADAQGNAATQLTLGNNAGDYKVTAYCGYASLEYTTTAIDPAAIFAEKQAKCKLIKISGDEQSADISTTLTDDFKIKAIDLSGDPLEGANVSFILTQGEGSSITVTEGTADAEGFLTTLMTLGNVSGISKVSAYCGYSTVEFSATAIDPNEDLAEKAKECKLTKVSGDGQSAMINTTVPNEFIIRATNLTDQTLSGALINLEVTQGNGASLSVTEGTTDEDGKISTQLTLGGDAGTYKITAYCGYSSIEFSTTAIDPAAILAERLASCLIIKAGGDEQNGDLNETLSPFKVIAKDTKGEIIEDANVTFTITQGNGASITNTTATTDTNGEATTILTLGPTTGDYKVTAVCSTSVVTFSTKAIDKVNSCELTRITPELQEGPAGTILVGGLKVYAVDGLGETAADRTVTFGISQGSGVTLGDQPVTTDENGIAATSVIIGPFVTIYKIIAFCGDSAVTFTINGTDPSGAACGGQKPFFLGLATATALDSSRIRLTWALASDTLTPQNNIEYLIYKSNVGPDIANFNLDAPNKIFSNNITGYTFTGLEQDTQYWFLVKAKNICEEKDDNEVIQSATTDAFVGPTFDGISSVTAIDADSIKITWPQAVDDPQAPNPTPHSAMTYKIYAFDHSDNTSYTFDEPPVASIIGTTEIQIDDLPDNHYAWYVVHAMNEVGGEDENVVTQMGNVRMIFQANIIGSHNWDNSTLYNRDQIELHHYYRPENPWRRSLIKFNLKNIPNTITSSVLKLYQYATNAAGGGRSIKFNRITSYYDPTIVTWNKHPIYDNVAHYSFPTLSNGHNEYEILNLVLDMMANNNYGIYVQPSGWSATYYLNWRDASNGTSSYRPKLILTLESGDVITFDTVTGNMGAPPAVPPTFTGLRDVAGVDDDTIRLFWTAAKDQTGYGGDTIYYKVFHSTTFNGTYSLLGSTDPGSTSYSHDGVTKGSTHYYYVRAVDSNGYEDENVIKKGGSTPSPAEDTWYNYSTDNGNHRGHGHKDESFLRIGPVYSGDYSYESILKFMINNMPDSDFESVRIDLYVYSGASTSSNYKIKYYEIASSWSEHEHTYKWFPSRGDLIDEVILEQGNGWYSFYITDLYTAWKAGSKSNHGVRFQHYDANASYHAYSSEASLEKRPRIVFEYTNGSEVFFTTSPDPAPGIPPEFTGASSADGSLAYGEIRVYWPLAFDNGDYRTYIKYNIYRSTTDIIESFDFNSPVGSVTGTTNYTDTGLDPATTYYYVVRAQDREGNEDDNEQIVKGSSGIAGMDAYGTTSQTWNSGSNDFHYIGYLNGSWKDMAMYTFFDIGNLPANVQEAHFEQRCHSRNISSNSTYDVYAQRITNGWDENVTSSVTVDSEKIVTQGYNVTYNCGSDYHPYDITSVYNAWKAGTYINYGLRFYDNSPASTNYYIRYYTFNSGSYKPRLRLIDAEGEEHTYTIFNTGPTMDDVTPTFSDATISTNKPSSHDQITVNWPNASDDTPTSQIVYKIYRRPIDEDFTYDVNDQVGEVTGITGFDDTTIDYGILYKYNVRAFDPGGKTDGNTNYVIAMVALKGIDCNTNPWSANSNADCGDATSTKAFHHSHTSYRDAANFAFDLVPLTNLNVSSLKLKLYQRTFNTGQGAEFWRITYHWNYPSTWYSILNLNKGQNYGSLVGGGWQELDITDYYNGVKAGTYQNLGFFMNSKGFSKANSWGFYSFENNAYNVSARLEVTLSNGESFPVRIYQKATSVSAEDILTIFRDPVPVFDGLKTILPDNDGCFTLDWDDGTSATNPANLVYDVYRASSEAGITWDGGSLYGTTLAGVTFFNDCTDVPTNPGTTYYYGVKARNTQGIQDANTVIKSMASPLFAYDTWYHTGAGDSNYGSHNYLYTRGNGQYRLFFKIKTEHLTNLPSDVMEAKLVFTKYSSSGCTNTTKNYVYPMRDDWDEDTLTYNNWGSNAPGVANTYAYATNSSNKWYYNITPFYNDWKSGDLNNYGVCIFCNEHSSYYVYFYSMDDLSTSWWNHPYLILLLNNGTTKTYYFRPDPNQTHTANPW